MLEGKTIDHLACLILGIDTVAQVDHAVLDIAGNRVACILHHRIAERLDIGEFHAIRIDDFI